MPYIRRACCALLVSALAISAADSGPAEGTSATTARPGITYAVTLPQGVTITPRQYQQYRGRFDKPGLPTSRVRTLAAAADASQAPQTAPFLPPSWIDETALIDAVAVGDVTNDSRADIVAFGPRPSPNQRDRQFTIYVQSANGAFDPPIPSAVTSQFSARPDGLVLQPVLGARPDVVAWGQFWIEIFPVASDGTVEPAPVTIAPGLAIRDVVIRDLNADGRPDVIVSGTDSNDFALPTRVKRYIQTSVGVFAETSNTLMAVMPYGADGTLADIDGDGIIDEIDVVSGTDFGFAYRHGLADGTFASPVTVLETSSGPTFVRGVFVRDVDGDGRSDVVLGTGEGARVRFQTAPGVFTTAQVPASGALTNVSHVTVGDLDGNGLADIIMWIDGYNLFQVALQTAPRVFTPAGQYDVPAEGTHTSFYEDTTLLADVSGDTKRDLLIVTSGLAVFFNSTGSYPVLDASLTTTAQADDSGAVASVQWQHKVSNSGPATLADSLLLQDLPIGYELSGANVPCAYFVTLVACSLPSLTAGSSTTVNIQARSVSERITDGIVHSSAFVSVGGQPIDTAPDNNGVEIATPVRGHPETLQAAEDEVFVYESAGDAIIPVINSPGTSSLARCMSYVLSGGNAPDGTGISGAMNGQVCTAPGQPGQSRVRFDLRDGATASAALHFNLAFSYAGFSAPGSQSLTIVDDDGSDPRLASSGTQPFEEWPAVFSSVSALVAQSGTTRGPAPRASAIGDLDGDGRNDLAISFGDSGVEPSYVLVWLQQPDGTLSNTPLRWSGSYAGAIASLAIGDVMGDRMPELVVPLYDQLDFLQVVGGQLQLVSSTPVAAWQVAVADLNRDGYADIVVADNALQSFDGPQYWAPNVTVFHGNAQRTLDATPYKFGMPYAGRDELVIGRFNDDALLDIGITSGQGNFPSVSIAYQTQDGTFAAPVGVWVAGPMHLDGLGFGDSVTTGDFDGDGKTDLAVGSFLGVDLPSVWIYTDLRNDDFSSPSQRIYAGWEGSLGALDIDHDGRDDLLVDVAVLQGFPGSPMRVWMQDAMQRLRYAGTLAQAGSGQNDAWIQKIAVGDLDGDGQKDAVILNYYNGTVHLTHSVATNQTVQLTTLESSDQIAPGAKARYRVRIANSGTRRSLEMPISWQLPQQLVSPQIVAAKGACYVASSKAECLLPQIEPGGYVDVMLTGTFGANGTYPMSISAGPSGAYGGGNLSTTVVASNSGGGNGSTGGGGSASSGGGGGSFDWLTVGALVGFALGRRQWHCLARARSPISL